MRGLPGRGRSRAAACPGGGEKARLLLGQRVEHDVPALVREVVDEEHLVVVVLDVQERDAVRAQRRERVRQIGAVQNDAPRHGAQRVEQHGRRAAHDQERPRERGRVGPMVDWIDSAIGPGPVVRDEPPQLRIERVIDRDAAALDEISSGQW